MTSALWLAGALVLVGGWWLGRDQRVFRRYGGALWCLVVATVVEAVMPWLTPRPANFAFVVAVAAVSFAIVRGLAVTADLVVRRRQAHFSTIFRDLATLLVYTVVVLAVLHSVDVDVSGLLTTSAIVTAVIGLALQETLGNVFSGLSLQMQKPFDLGEWIGFDGNVGRVQGIGWRSTSIVTRNLEVLDVPNAFLARAVVRTFRGEAIGDELFVGVSYASPPSDVKDVIVEVLREVPDVVATPPPTAEVVDYGDFAIKYRIRFWMRDYARLPVVRDAIMSKLWYAFQRHDMEIPFPTGNVYLREAPARRSQDERVQAQGLAALRQVDFLAELDDAELGMLRPDVREAVFGRDEIICREGDPGDAFFVLQRGVVEVVVQGASGRETHVAELRAPAFFGEMALLTGEARAATVRAKRDAVLLIVERAGFEALFKTRPSVAAAVSRVLATRQSELRERRGQSVATESSESRARRLLLKMQAIFRF
ncbi:MAG: mechanosensitive ion channel family protein [Deltaproteobacteria bacterium]|nr:mechanosensitive ion channel family protein [Deltaproteobacteria bacterium]